MAANTLTPYERETTVNGNDEDDFILVTTYQRTRITELRKNPVAEVVWENPLGAQFKLPSWSLGRFRTKRREGAGVGTEASSERMAKARAARGTNG